MKQIKNKIFDTLYEAQKISDANKQDKLYDLIGYNMDLLYDNDLEQKELEQLNRFASYALKTVKSYSLMLKNTLV